MSLFKKKKEEEKSCCCSGKCTPKKIEQPKTEKMSDGIKILGSGCAKCNSLEVATKDALAELKMNDSIEHITDFSQIASYGVMTTPALVIDGKIMSYGKVLKKDEVITILKKVRGQ